MVGRLTLNQVILVRIQVPQQKTEATASQFHSLRLTIGLRTLNSLLGEIHPPQLRMKRKELVNQTEGAYLRKDYLEAFVIQSAYIESILREFISNKFHQHLSDGLCQSCEFMNAVRKKVIGISLHGLIELLYEGKYIDSGQKAKMQVYKNRRNNILHELLKHISNPTFEKELSAAYEAGKEVLDDKRLKWIEELIDAREEHNILNGKIIQESLTDFSIINKFTAMGYSLIQKENPADNLHEYHVLAVNDWLPLLQKYLKEGWFAYFWNETKLKIVFSSKIFEVDPHREETWKSAIDYGLSKQIPIEMLKFPMK